MSNADAQISDEQIKLDKTMSDLSVDTLVQTFDDLNLKTELLRGISSYGFARPSAIQSRALAPCIQGRDVIAQAQSGTGKTGTFVIASLQRLNIDPSQPIRTQVMALAPTRELATQSYQVFTEIGQYMKIKVVNLIGGEAVANDQSALRNGAHVVVGCPGRVIHMINENYLVCDHIKVFILDEADDMLKVGFRDQIYMIFQRLPQDVQVILLSATMPNDVIAVTEKFMVNPVKIIVNKEEITLNGIKQFYFVANDYNEKSQAVLDILGYVSIPQMVIFCNTQKEASLLYETLKSKEFKVMLIHSSKTQSERSEIMHAFRKQEARILIATNLISRGIDVQSVALVINYDLPRELDTYIHRIGRSGRFGRRGVAINLILSSEQKKLEDIISHYHTEISELPEDFYTHFSSSSN